MMTKIDSTCIISFKHTLHDGSKQAIARVCVTRNLCFSSFVIELSYTTIGQEEKRLFLKQV